MSKWIVRLIWMVFATLVVCQNNEASSIAEDTYERLDKIRGDKRQQLFSYWEQVRENADAVKDDEAVRLFFTVKNRYYHLQKTAVPPEELTREIEDLKQQMMDHYLRKYRQFYDMVFIDKGGDVFFTIRKQGDYHKNLFEGDLAETALAKQLKQNPRQTFVDYQYFAVSDEPSSFFIVPIIEGDELQGWIAFQCAINKINSMFTQNEGLGVTGEVFLVNRHHRMLTDSRFAPDSSILKRQLSAENISAKFLEKSGHKRVIDYRGFDALSSFDVCHIAGSDWLLIAKIDWDEVLTKAYAAQRDTAYPRLLAALRNRPLALCSEELAVRKRVDVDMDEYRRVHHGEQLHTWGVSTCTALIVSYPKRFAYMAHISALDRVYGSDTTDLIGHVMNHIENFDMYPYERRRLQVTIVANHFNSLEKIIDALLEKGIFLSQIRFMVEPDALHGRVVHDYMSDETQVCWLMDSETGETRQQSSQDIKPVSVLVDDILTAD